MVLIFINTVISPSLLFTLILLIQRDVSEIKKEFYNTSIKIFIVGYLLGFIMSILSYMLNNLVLSTIINANNLSNSCIALISIGNQLVSLFLVVLEICLLIFIIKR